MKRIPDKVRKIITSLRDDMTASEIAEYCDVSERTVTRIWAEASRTNEIEQMADDLNDISEAIRNGRHWHGSLPEMVQAEVIAQIEHMRDQRALYMAKQDAHPLNAAWGNIVLRYDQQINEMLRMKGNWYGLERQREPMSCIGVKNRDYHDTDEAAQMIQLAQAISEYKRKNGIDEGHEMTMQETVKAMLSLPAFPKG